MPTQHQYTDIVKNNVTMNRSVQVLYDVLKARGLHPEAVASVRGTMLLFEYAGRLRAINGTAPDLSSATGRTIANNKHLSYIVARKVGVRTPETVLYESSQQAAAFMRTHGRIVVKPLDAAHGDGVSVGIETEDALRRAVREAQRHSPTVILQQQVSGADIRVLVAGDTVVAVAERRPAYVTGDGTQTIETLVEQENENPLRGVHYEKPMNVIDVERAKQYVGARFATEIPAEKTRVQVVGTANIGSGGTAVNRTDTVPPQLCDEAVRFATEVGLFICGVDFMYDETTKDWYFIEVNSSPSFGLHLWPSEGEAIAVADRCVEALLARYDTED